MVDPELPPLRPGQPLPPTVLGQALPPTVPQLPVGGPQGGGVEPLHRPYKANVIEEMVARLAAERAGITTPDPAATPQQEANRRTQAAAYSRTEHGYETLTTPRLTPRTPTIERPGFEPYPSTISAAATSVGGLRRLFTKSGRQELRTIRQRRAKEHELTMQYVAGRVRDPRGTPVDPNDPSTAKGPGDRGKHGWVGTHKVFHEGLPGIGGADAGDLSDLIMKGKIADPHARVTPSQVRPVTLREQFDDFRIDGKMRKERKNRMNAEWLERSYPEMMDPRSGARLRRGEKKLMRKSARRAQKAARKARIADGKIDKIAGL